MAGQVAVADGSRGLTAFFGVIMDTNKTVNAQVSAFADGGLDGVQAATILKALQEPAGRAAWDEYHLIGDVLRSSDSAVAMTPDFSARMAARLADEPIHIGAALVSPKPVHRAWRAGISGAAMAATVLLTVLVGPRLIGTQHPEAVAETAGVARTADGIVAVATAKPGTVVLRDVQIDEYLLAHQRFSPSIYSTALYARSSTFATESDK